VFGVLQRFTNEDHLSVHLAKHEMSLSLTSGTTRAGIATFVGQYLNVQCWVKSRIPQVSTERADSCSTKDMYSKNIQLRSFLLAPLAVCIV